MKAISNEVKEELLAQIAEGKSLRTICKQGGMPCIRAVLYWRRNDEEFAHAYEQAREAGADAHADEIRELAMKALEKPEEAHAVRVALDALKWLASKQNWRRYGDKVEQHVVSIPQSPEDVARRIAQLEGELADMVKSVH